MQKWKNIYSYIITFLIWTLIFYVIDQTKNSNLFSIDHIITTLTLASLMLQNFKVEEIKFIQDKIISKISITHFTQRSWHLFLVLGIFILPIITYEIPRYIELINDELDIYNRLGKQLIILAILYSALTKGLFFLGKDIDNFSKNSVTRKYGVFYGILLSLYITIKWTVVG